VEWIVGIVIVLLILGWLGQRANTAAAPARSRHRGAADRTTERSGSGVTITYGGRSREAKLGLAEATAGDRVWRSPGETVEVHGAPINAGLIYVGSGLAALNGYGPEPALVDPKLQVDKQRLDWAGAGLDYWPSYSTIPAGSRAAYLSWLSRGRPLESIPLGYVFLFFYGLERRVLVDARQLPVAASEVPTIRAEVVRLLGAYGESGSFRSYATGLLDAIDALFPDPDADMGERPTRFWELPLSLRARIGTIVAAAQPLPASQALEWVLSAPDVDLRTPAVRCPDEFAALFLTRYEQRYGTGMTIKEPRRRLEAHYRPASASFGGPVKLPIGDLPDVAGLTAPVARLHELADACTDELDAYSRWLGRNPREQGSLAAAALLPGELLESHQSQEVQGLRAWLDGRVGETKAAAINAEELLRHWPAAADGKLNKADSVLLAQLLGRLGYGMEPDVRFEGPTLDPAGSVVLFRQLRDAPLAPSPSYSAATVVARLGVAIAAADDAVAEEELAAIDAHLTEALELTQPESSRLDAHLHWLRAASPSLTGLKKRVAHLSAEQRDELGAFLIAVAGADGHIGPAEVTALGRLYGMIGLNPQSAFTRVHGFATGAGGVGPRALSVVADGTGGAVTLDMERVQAKLHETRAVSALLSGVFVEEEAEVPAMVVPSEPGIAGLDAAHSALLRQFQGRPSVSRSDFEEEARHLGLLPDGALDTINDAAFDRVGIAVTTGDDPIEVDAEALQEMLA
jgi:uncharacterized tellurite resistance protein B-like protein